jgi:hypothetical protein
MGHGRCTFKQADVVRAVKACTKAGLEVARVEVDKDGRIIIVTGKPESNNNMNANPWDEVLDHGRH